MHTVLFFLPLSAWAAAQPAEASLEQVADFARTDLSKDSYDEIVMREISAQHFPRLNPVPEANFSLCYN